MADVAAIILVKSFTYRGVAEEWSNRYHFTAAPATDADWVTAYAALIAKEKTLYSSAHAVVRAYGYDVGADHASNVHDYRALGTSIPGTYTNGDGQGTPGDAAATIRWWTGAFISGTTRKVYLRKYFHGVFSNLTLFDSVAANHKTAYTTFASGILGAGTITGMGSYCGPTGDVPTTSLVSPFITTRTLKRRGKRNPT